MRTLVGRRVTERGSMRSLLVDVVRRFLPALAVATLVAGANAQTPPCQVSIEREAFEGGSLNGEILAGDLNGDGLTDAIHRLPTRLILSQPGEAFVTTALAGGTPVAIGDLDGDGDLDLVRIVSSGLEVGNNDGSAAFSPGAMIPTSDGFTGARLADIDGDGDLDLFALRRVPGALRLYTNDGLGTFSFVEETVLPDYIQFAAVGDVDGNGAPDLVCSHVVVATDYSITLMDTNGSTISVAEFDLAGAGTVSVADLDGVPPLDIYIPRYVSTHRIILGTGTIIDIPASSSAQLRGGVADFDGDGIQDLYSYAPQGPGVVEIRLGLGGATYSDSVLFSGSEGISSTTGDFNGDGLPEIITQYEVYWNRTFDFEDCNGNGVADSCDILTADCNDNGVPDDCDIASGLEVDTDGDGLPDSCEQFTRGDANGDGSIDVTDAVRILFALFAGGAPLGCATSGDVNDDETVDVTDAVMLLNHVFVTGVAIPPPYPNCGVDPTAGPLGCDEPHGCP